MNAQMNADGVWTLQGGTARHLGLGSGELSVVRGRIWVTGQGDGQDQVISSGERLRLRDSQDVVIEAWDRGEAALVRWQPRVHGFGLRGLFGLVFAALARKAASSASLAQGSIKVGDSMASCGALK